MRNPFLVGDRVYLRPLDEEDIDFCVESLNSPAVTRFLGIAGPLNRIREREWIQKLYQQPGDLALGICDQETELLIGVTGLHGKDFRDHHAEFGIFVAEPYWDQGLGSEAMGIMVDYGFCEMNLHRIYLRVIDFNERAIRVYEKQGFRLEGKLREHVYRAGEYHDMLFMGLLRSEWKQGREWHDSC